MIYRLDMDADTRVLMSHLPPSLKRKVQESLRSIAKDPAQGKMLQEELAGLRSYRVGHLRIVYAVDRSKRMVHVIAVGPRKTIYEELEREITVRPRK